MLKSNKMMAGNNNKAFLAILTLLGNLIADILYAVVDPRVRIA